jgi:hypothetical protein
MNLDGGGQQELTQFTAAVRDECMDATWSTDGKTIVFWSELKGHRTST